MTRRDLKTWDVFLYLDSRNPDHKPLYVTQIHPDTPLDVKIVLGINDYPGSPGRLSMPHENDMSRPVKLLWRPGQTQEGGENEWGEVCP